MTSPKLSSSSSTAARPQMPSAHACSASKPPWGFRPEMNSGRLSWYLITTAQRRQSRGEKSLKQLEPLKKEARAAARDIGDAAEKKAEGVVALAVEKGSDKICQVGTERVRATADDVAATHKRRERIAGAGLALAFIGLGAALAWFYIEAQIGICREPPVRNPDGSVVCYAKSVPN